LAIVAATILVGTMMIVLERMVVEVVGRRPMGSIILIGNKGRMSVSTMEIKKRTCPTTQAYTCMIHSKIAALGTSHGHLLPAWGVQEVLLLAPKSGMWIGLRVPMDFVCKIVSRAMGGRAEGLRHHGSRFRPVSQFVAPLTNPGMMIV